MARPVWSGSLTFGLVTLPVRLYTATDSHTLHFHQIQRGTSDRIRNQRVNERTGEEVAADDIVKGLDAGDAYVLVEPEELDDIAPGRSKALEISGFVELAEVEPVFFDRTYYLGPRGKEYAKVYALLQRALDRSGKAGIATFVMRNREYLVAVKAEGDVLALHTLHWADEVRDPHQEVTDLPGRAKPTEKELKTALQLIEALATPWNPEDYRDTYQERVRRLVAAKSKGETVEKEAEAPESTNVIDLMDVLNASLNTAQGEGWKRPHSALRPGRAQQIGALRTRHRGRCSRPFVDEPG
ncbi:Ku protein [Streptomyces sp. N2A]|uniref:non-homologous end joining protein Ku n=1 Tax=Streptomyces sp. N2A TaxID=3073936 RepID=UPI0037DA2411